jgi:hypothetical protein
MSAPTGICPNCLAVYWATVPRPPFVHCWHNATVARQRKDGSWRTLDHVTPDELKALQTNEVSK